MDTLTANGIEQAFATWLISYDHAISEKFTRREDKFSIFIPGSGVADPIFAFETIGTFRTGRALAAGAFSGGTQKFVGKANPPVAMIVGNKQGVTYEFLGPWYDLSNTHYEQSWQGIAVNPYSVGETILNTGIAPNSGALLFISVGDQIQAILQWLLDQYSAQGMTAPFQYTGRALNPNTKTIDLTTTGTGAVGVNSDKSGNQYKYLLQNNPTIDAALYSTFLVSYITKPLMCSQALEKMLELSPRTNIAFDYSTPTPTIYVRSIDNFAPVSLPILDNATNTELNIRRRDDLKARAIKILYRITSTVNGQQAVDYTIDKWGPNGSNNAADPGTGLRVLSETIDLQGPNTTTTSAQIDCEPLALIGGTNATKRAFWSSRRGGEQAKMLDSRMRFQDGTFTETIIPDGALTYATTGGTDAVGNPRIAGQPLSLVDQGLFVSRIVQGTYHDWMAAQGVFALKVRASIKVQHAVYDVVATGDVIEQLPANESASNTAINGNRQGAVNSEEIHVNLQLTNAVNPVGGGKFTATTIASITAGEIGVIGAGGIANYLWNALQKFQYEGEGIKVESDFTNNVGLTNALNLSGGRVEWTTMNAQIQSVREDWGKKETTVTIGPANHLNAGQLSTLLNMWAFRRPWYNPLLRVNNSDGNSTSSQVQMPDNSGGANSTDGVKNHAGLNLLNYITQPTPTAPGVINTGIILDPVKTTFLDTLNAQ